MSGPPDERDGRNWQQVIDLALLAAVFFAATARAFGLLTTSQFFLALAVAFGAACAAYIVSVLREDATRPRAFLPLVALAALVLIDEIALGGIGPRWLEILAVLGVLLYAAINREPGDEGAPRNVDDRPHPYP